MLAYVQTWFSGSFMHLPKQHGVITQSDFRAISFVRIPILIKLGESLVVFEHFVLWKLEPFSGDRPKCPECENAESDRGYDSNNCVDHWPCGSLCPLSYMLWTYFTSRRRSSSLRRLFHAGMELPGIPCSIAPQALSAEG